VKQKSVTKLNWTELYKISVKNFKKPKEPESFKV